ncbi:MAG: RNA polymerase sigma-70 factor [Bacteroidota bacterium]
MLKNQLTDIELWKAISEDDDTAAFSVLFDRYWSKIFTTAFSYIRDKEACNEITHDIFLNLWLKRKQLHIEFFANYLRASARYHVYKHQKILRAIPLQYTDDLEQMSHAPYTQDCDEKIRYMELENRVEGYLNNLPKRCREIFILSRMENLSNDEIANRLQISKRTVENQITHALHHLRISLKDISAVLILYHYMHK